jgi:hypothetical protein
VSFYSLNEQIAAERAENSPPGTAGGQYKGRPATGAVKQTGAAKNAQTGAAAASGGGYARYCEEFSTKNNSGSSHFFITQLFKIAQVYTLIINAYIRASDT